MTTALITGVTGQDGFYLAQLLIANGYRIIGATRDVRKAASDLGPDLLGKSNWLSGICWIGQEWWKH